MATQNNVAWADTLEPEIEIKESELSFRLINVEDDAHEEEQYSDSDEENPSQPIQECESVLMHKTCEICGNPFQAFELINTGENKKRHLATCEKCSYYISPHSFKLVNKSDVSNKYECDKCQKTFSRKDGLNRHQVTHSELRPFKCKLCQKCFKRNDKLIQHTETTHIGQIDGIEKMPDVMCDICGDLEEVITVVVDDKTLNLCDVCNLSRKERISDSTREESKLFQCDLCSRKFSRKDHAIRHRLTHLDVKPYECYICQKSFHRNDRLLRHMKTHPNAKPFSCQICFEAFTDRNELKSHQAIIHPNSKPNKHGCNVCEKVFRDKDKLQRHLVVHVGYKPHSCELCGKSFKLQETLLSHQQMHSNAKPFKCKACGLAFKVKETLKRHLLVHANILVYTCEVCSKTFKRKDELNVHSQVHLDVKPFICSVCNSSFKRKDHFMRHCKEVHRLDSQKVQIYTEL